MKVQQTKDKGEKSVDSAKIAPAGMITKLDFNSLKTMLQETDPSVLKTQKFVMQVLSLKDVESEKIKEGAPEKSEKEKMKAVKFK